MAKDANWSNCNLRTVTNIFPLLLEPSFDNGEFVANGIMGLLIMEIFKWLNFKPTELNTVITNSIGKVFENGTSTGLLHYLMNNLSDFGTFPTVYDYRCLETLDFTVPVEVTEFTFISGPPKFTRYDTWAPLKIFTAELWVITAVTYFLVFGIWTVAEGKAGYVSSITRNFAQAAIVLLNKSAKLETRLSNRVMWGTWFLNGFVLSSAFLGCLLSKVTMPDEPHLINSCEDMLLYPNVKIAMFKGTSVDMYLSDSEDPKMRAVHEQAARTGGIVTREDVDFFAFFHEITNSKTVIIATPEFVYLGLNIFAGNDNSYPNIEKSHISQDSLFTTFLTFPIRKDVNPVFREKFKTIISRLMDHGIILKEKMRAGWPWKERLEKMFKSTDVPPGTLRLKNILLPFIFLFTGIIISTLTFMLELYFSARKINA